MMKKVLYLILLSAFFAVGCQRSTTDQEQNLDRSKTPIVLKVGGLDVGLTGEDSDLAPLTRAVGGAGQIMTSLSDFGSSNLTIFGVAELNAIQKWASIDRIIDTHLATVDPTTQSIVFLKTGENPKYYPTEGSLSVYAIYPAAAAGSPVQITTDDGIEQPTATITIAQKFVDQYDILHAKAEQVSVASAQSLKLTFDHMLAQLKFKIKKEDFPDITAGLSKIEVRGVSKATFQIGDLGLTPSTNANDLVDFVAYDGVPIQVGVNPVLVSIDPLILIPGKASIRQIVLTIDGQKYFADVPSEWELKQGRVNTITLTVRKFGVRIDGHWTVSPWAKGADHQGDIENNGRMLSLKTQLIDGSKLADKTTKPTFADIEVDGNYTHKGVAIQTNTDGLIATEQFNTGIIHDEPISLTALKLYTGDNYTTATKIFDAKLTKGLTAGGKKVLFDIDNQGRLVLEGAIKQNYNISTLFGGFGEGTTLLPYEVSNVSTLRSVSKFTGSTAATNINGTVANGGCFVQVADIDLTGVDFKPLTPVCVKYNGQGFKLANLTIKSTAETVLGLFSLVNNPNALIESISISSGSITYNRLTTSTAVAAVVGSLTKGTVLNCVNHATINGGQYGSNVGGIVGSLGATASVVGCANFADVAGYTPVGGVVGNVNASALIEDCYNRGKVSCVRVTANTYTGGIVGRMTFNANKNTIVSSSYNVGVVEPNPATSIYMGSIVGYAAGAFDISPLVSKIFYLNTTYPTAVGDDKTTGKVLTSKIESKTETQFKQAAMVDELNNGRTASTAKWKADHSTPINSGYPILMWQ